MDKMNCKALKQHSYSGVKPLSEMRGEKAGSAMSTESLASIAFHNMSPLTTAMKVGRGEQTDRTDIKHTPRILRT